MPYHSTDRAPAAVSPHILSEFTVDEDRRILIVDDEEPVRKLFSIFLGESYPCETASSADEALALARQPYALVVTDIIMPGRNGTEFLREIVARYPDTAVIIASGIDRTQRVLDAVRLGAFDYLHQALRPRRA